MSLTRLCLAAALLVLGTSVGEAQDAPLLEGTFTIDIYNGNGGGQITSPGVQALLSNPLITGATTPLATVTYVGSLNFALNLPPSTSSTIADFLNSGTGSYSPPLSPTVGGLNLSSAPFADTTVFVIKFKKGAIPDGGISHDDGFSIYVNNLLKTSPADAAPTSEVTTPFTTPAGNYQLVYVAANGNPSILGARGTPEPVPDFVDFGCRIDLTQLASAGFPAAFQFVLPASTSQKFCPENFGGTLRLTCSGQIPDYTGPVVTDATGIQCKISGSQCGINAVLDANVKSINISASGVASLECEKSVSD